MAIISKKYGYFPRIYGFFSKESIKKYSTKELSKLIEKSAKYNLLDPLKSKK